MKGLAGCALCPPHTVDDDFPLYSRPLAQIPRPSRSGSVRSIPVYREGESQPSCHMLASSSVIGGASEDDPPAEEGVVENSVSGNGGMVVGGSRSVLCWSSTSLQLPSLFLPLPPSTTHAIKGHKQSSRPPLTFLWFSRLGL